MPLALASPLERVVDDASVSVVAVEDASLPALTLDIEHC